MKLKEDYVNDNYAEVGPSGILYSFKKGLELSVNDADVSFFVGTEDEPGVAEVVMHEKVVEEKPEVKAEEVKAKEEKSEVIEPVEDKKSKKKKDK